MRHTRVLVALAALGTLVASCSLESEAEPPSGVTREPLSLAKVEPLVKVNVKGAGELDVEDNYLPQVVCCENGAAPPEALKAQAVMARSYMVFRYYGEGVGTAAKPLSGTTADQAYFCKQPVSTKCKDAVTATKGQITAYTNAKGDRFANVSFFVDGPRPECIAQKACTCAKPGPTVAMSPADHPADCMCFTFSSQGAANPAYVTYNWSRAGAEVTGSTIGDPKNESNRGCASQNIQACLAYAGWTYADMLRVFYGQDIELRLMDGSEVNLATPPAGGAPSPTSPSGANPGANADGSGGGDDGGCAIAAPHARSERTGVTAVVLFASLWMVGLRRRAKERRRSSAS